MTTKSKRNKIDKQKYFPFALLKGSSTPIRHLSLKALLPNTEQYMTYEGSTTHPGCWESAVWIIYNKPIYITKQEVRHFHIIKCKFSADLLAFSYISVSFIISFVFLYESPLMFVSVSFLSSFQLYALRKLMQGSQESPKAPLGNNVRPLQPLHYRTVRTNIDFPSSSDKVSFVFFSFLFLNYCLKNINH